MTRPVVVLDLETQRSADDCQYCGESEAIHQPLSGGLLCRRDATTRAGSTFTAIGWNNRPALGLSIGCYYSSADAHLHWFDARSLHVTVRHLVETAPLLVSFNGIAFDFPLMRGLLRRQAEALLAAQEHGENQLDAEELIALCDTFKAQCATSYDLLAEIWKSDPASKFERGLNSLDALCKANGLPPKEMDGATAPRLWAQGRYAEVIQYNVHDVYRTKALFEMVCRGEPIRRGDGSSLLLPWPPLPLQGTEYPARIPAQHESTHGL